MSQQKESTTLLALIENMMECRRKQKAFRKEKNTQNYKAMLNSEQLTDEMLTAARKYVISHFKELNIEILL